MILIHRILILSYFGPIFILKYDKSTIFYITSAFLISCHHFRYHISNWIKILNKLTWDTNMCAAVAKTATIFLRCSPSSESSDKMRMDSLYHPYIVFWFKVSILLCFNSNKLFRGTNVQNIKERNVFSNLSFNQFCFI